MAIAAVAATKIQGLTASVSAAVSATAGNALIVGGGYFSAGSGWTVTRTGDTYTTDTTGKNGSNDGMGIASAPNVAGGSVTCQITVTSGQGTSAWALEFSGLPTSSILDATSPAVATGTSTTPTSNAETNATADAVFVSAFGDDSGNTTVSPGSGYTNVVGGTTMAEANGASQMVGGLEYQIVSSAASRSASWTVGNSAAWSAGIAVYKAAAGGGGGGGQAPRSMHQFRLRRV